LDGFLHSALAAMVLLFLAVPLSAQHVDDPGEVQIVTSHETEKDSGLWVDGEYIGYLRDFWGNKKISLSPGEHQVTLRKFGYKDFSGEVSIQPGQIQYLPASMELDVTTQYPTENTVNVRLNVTPMDAAVLIDGAYVGYVRQIRRSLVATAGRRRVRIEMQGYRPYENEFELTAGRTFEIRAVLEKGGPERDGLPRVVQASIRDGATSLRLNPGRLYLYGMAVGGPGRSSLFGLGQYASVFHEGGMVAAAVAYGDNDVNTYTTQAERHILGGVSIGGTWQTIRAFYGSNAASGASGVQANFTVDQNSLVVVLGLASSRQEIALEGLPSLELDMFHGGAGASAAMVIAHAELSPGMYTVTQRSSALAADADRDTMADLIAVFVFGHH
jgi:hypothetical protein